MAITFSCKCGKAFQVKEENAGKKARCPACGNVLIVPAPTPEDDAGFEVIEDDAESPSAAKPATGIQTTPPAKGADEPAPSRKKKRRRKGRKPGELPEWALPLGGCLLAVFGCMAVLGIIALKGYPLLAMGLGTALAIGVPVGLVLLILSMFIASAVSGGIDFGDVRVAAPKAVGLLSVVNLIGFIPFVGSFIAVPIWFMGLMNLFRLDLWETRVLFLINWGVGSLFRLFVLSLIVTSIIHEASGDKDRDIPGPGKDTMEIREEDNGGGEAGKSHKKPHGVRPGRARPAGMEKEPEAPAEPEDTPTHAPRR